MTAKLSDTLGRADYPLRLNTRSEIGRDKGRFCSLFINNLFGIDVIELYSSVRVQKILARMMENDQIHRKT